MGFLDNLLKQGTRKIVSSVVDSVVDSVKSEIKGNNAKVVSGSDEEDCCYDEAVIRARVEKVFSEEWSGYEVRRNVWAYEMGAEEGSHDYSYGLYLNGQPKAMVMVLKSSDDYRKKSVKLAHKACEEKGVFCMNLMPHLPNRRSYISKRLKDNVPA